MRRIGSGGVMLAVSGLFLAGCFPETAADRPAMRGADVDGAALYAAHCAACHGDSGRGDGPAAAGLSPRPGDLTTLTDRAGGSFPQVAVMARIYGYAEGSGQATAMPRFDTLVEGEMVLVETDPGVMTPTPLRLVELADHVRRLQR